MQTAYGIRFLPVARVGGTVLGLDARWLGSRGLMLIVLLVLFTPGGPLSGDSLASVAVKWAIGLSSLLAVVLTSMLHECGHALAGRLAGLPVRAIVLAPEGAATIREESDRPHVNFRTALAGPLVNACLGTACAVVAGSLGSHAHAATFFSELAALQLLTGLANLLPIGPLDGTRIVAAWRACRAA
jgi:Zn-dependent protease